MPLSTPLDRTRTVNFAGEHAPTSATPAEWSLLTALVELTDAVLRVGDEATLYRTLALGLNQCLGGEYTALASLRGGRVRIEVFTHLESFDRNADLVRRLERECEAYIDGTDTTVRVVEIAGGERIACVPLVSTSAKAAAVALVKPSRSSEFVTRDAMSLVGDHLGPAVEAKTILLRPSMFAGWWCKWRETLTKNKRHTLLLGIVLCAIGALPLPYKVRCDAELEPVVRRHVAAPFDGILQQSFVKPGDVVAANQALGRLDAKELTWEIAAATAERDRAAKSRSANMAVGKTSAAQIDALESRRLTERLKLLDNRLMHLDIVAPVAGVIVSGDMDRVEGAPVKIGQSLFEVAPLDRMVVEVLVPEAEIDRIAIGQTIELDLDASSAGDRHGTVERIHPRAELRDGANVFVAEVVLDNVAGSLRPGMKGVAEVRTERMPLAWIAVQRIGGMFRRVLR